jgi:hypothetical protein
MHATKDEEFWLRPDVQTNNTENQAIKVEPADAGTSAPAPPPEPSPAAVAGSSHAVEMEVDKPWPSLAAKLEERKRKADENIQVCNGWNSNNAMAGTPAMCDIYSLRKTVAVGGHGVGLPPRSFWTKAILVSRHSIQMIKIGPTRVMGWSLERMGIVVQNVLMSRTTAREYGSR